MSYPVLGFHGTNAGNITPICEKGFKVPGILYCDNVYFTKTDIFLINLSFINCGINSIIFYLFIHAETKFNLVSLFNF